MKNIIDKLFNESKIEKEELLYLLDNLNDENREYLISKANDKKLAIYGNVVYMRGLIEFTNYCKRNCLYCGIRAGNPKAERYRLSLEEIMSACSEGWRLGFRTFVLQGGEDSYYSDEKILEIITMIKNKYPEAALTLSLGEKSRESYKSFYDAGADRYLLRQETVSKELYKKLHPGMSLDDRIRCLYDLKEIGYQVGAGFLVGLPGQSNIDFVEDLFFLKKLQPQMIGIGPFIPHQDTPLANENAGTAEKTVMLLAILRLLLPDVLIPATTALGSIESDGREKGLKAGANVVMPNLSPVNVRSKYSLYDGKICTGDEAAECRVCIENRIKNAGFEIDMSRGDHILWRDK